MKKVSLFLVAAVVLTEAAALAQLRITSFNPRGELSWTNSVYRGFYSVEAATSLAGPWRPLATVADLDWSKTNRMALQVPLSNGATFHRVAWIPPDPNGVWDYRGYDYQGALVITGQLSIALTAVLSPNPDNPVHGVQGSWKLQYAGPPTNALWWLRPQIGTGYLGGTLDFAYASLTLSWPTNCVDCNIQLARDIWANTYTGRWTYVTWVGPQFGSFIATRTASTNLINNMPETTEGAKDVGNLP